MNDKFKSVKFVSIFSKILGVISSILTILQFILIYKSGIVWYSIFFVIFIILLCLLIVFRKKITENILKFIMNLTCPDKMYKLKKKEVVYEFYSREEMYHEKNFYVDVLHDGFTNITDKFKWTGEQQLVPEAKYDNQFIEILDEKFGMQRYSIKFNHGISYSKHNNVPVMSMVINNIIDHNKKSSLHLSTGVFEVTDCLILHIIFNNKLKPINIRKLEFIHYSDDEHYRCINSTYTYNNETDKKEIIWEIKNPFYGGKYMIDWEFE